MIRRMISFSWSDLGRDKNTGLFGRSAENE